MSPVLIIMVPVLMTIAFVVRYPKRSEGMNRYMAGTAVALWLLAAIQLILYFAFPLPAAANVTNPNLPIIVAGDVAGLVGAFLLGYFLRGIRR